jgi:hypothetical protein
VLSKQVLEILPAQSCQSVRAGGWCLSPRKHRSTYPCQGLKRHDNRSRGAFRAEL